MTLRKMFPSSVMQGGGFTLMVAALFLPFSRPAETRLVVEALLRTPPSRLYIAKDGPRRNNARDEVLCGQVSELLDSIDWPCEVYTLYQKENLGANEAITRHIDWFFAHEERGVIFEDDCVPDVQFLNFCDVLLDRYADEPRVMSISGNTPFAQDRPDAKSYWYSIFCLSWGWVTWRRSWQLYRRNLEGLTEFLQANRFPGVAAAPSIAARWADRFTHALTDPRASWFLGWQYSCWVNNGLTVMPSVNLVRNVGMDQGGKQAEGLAPPGRDIPYGQLQWPLVGPDVLEPRADDDEAFMRAFFHL